MNFKATFFCAPQNRVCWRVENSSVWENLRSSSDGFTLSAPSLCSCSAHGLAFNSWSVQLFLSQKRQTNIKTRLNKSRHLGSSPAVPLCQVAVAMELPEIMSLSLPEASSSLHSTASNLGSNFFSSLYFQGKCNTFLFKSVSCESFAPVQTPSARHKGNLVAKLEEDDGDFSRFQTDLGENLRNK